MKHLLRYSLISLLAIPAVAQAQSKNDKPTLQPPPAAVTVDGDLKEWGDSLRYSNSEKKISYTIANDKTNIYLAVKISDRSEQRRVMMAGITFSIDPKGRKKETYSVTFPYVDPEAMQAQRLSSVTEQLPQTGSNDDHEERMQAQLTRLKQIRATGFKDVLNDIITTANLYGIKTALNYDDKGYLIYEAAVPIAMLHAENDNKNEWAFNIKINGVPRPEQASNGGQESSGGRGGRGGMGGGGRGGMGGGGRGGMGGGGRGGMRGGTGGDRSEVTKSVDVWDKFYLAGSK